MKSFKEFAEEKGYQFIEAKQESGSNPSSLTMDAKDFPIEECAPEVMKVHAAFQNPKVKNYFHELQKEQPDEKYFKFGKTPQHDRTAREIASTSRDYAKNLKFEKHKLYLTGNVVKTWVHKRIHNAQTMNPEFPCAFCESSSDWNLGTTGHPNEVWVILHQGQKDGIIPKDATINWGDKTTGEIVVKMAALRHLRKNVKINIKPFKITPQGPEGETPKPQFGVDMHKDKANFSKNSEALYLDIDERKIYDPTMLGISDLTSKKDEEGDKATGDKKEPSSKPKSFNKPMKKQSPKPSTNLKP